MVEADTASCPSPSAGHYGLVSRSAFGEAFRDAVRLYVGVGRKYSVKQLARGTGLTDRLIEGLIAPIDSPEWREAKGSVIATIGRFLGAEFTTEWTERLMRQATFNLPEPGPLDAAAIMRGTAGTAASVVGILSSGGGDARALRACGRELVGYGHALAA